ncbi:MAG: TetR family transcriptional regulator, partial [Rhizobiales bacterium]|nr:TetR family transcriptional regulator [Hyphomicrobiales bacterium]
MRGSGSRSARPPGRRAEKGAATRQAILDAALDAFSAKGFAATRLDDVARGAGVAKGTIYVHFRDKETLFEELVRAYLGPLVGTLTASQPTGLSPRAFARAIVDVFVREVLGTRRKDVLRLVLTEGARFPELAQIYYREVISKAVPHLRLVFGAAHAQGALRSDALARFPHL